MNPTIKRIIAREFLFLLSTAILYLASIYVFYYLEETNGEAVKATESEIANVTTYDELPYRLKIFYYLDREMGSYLFVQKLGARKKVIEELNDKEIAVDVYEFIDGWGNIDISEKEFIEKIVQDKNSGRSETYLEQKILPLEEKLQELTSSPWNWRNNDREDEILIFLVGIIFFLRYLIYATTWSIRQLRNPISN